MKKTKIEKLRNSKLNTLLTNMKVTTKYFKKLKVIATGEWDNCISL